MALKRTLGFVEAKTDVSCLALMRLIVSLLYSGACHGVILRSKQ